jgi:hypothetical protein
MKRALLAFIGIAISFSVFCQTKYYKGEWSKSDGSYLFRAFVKLDFKGNSVTGEIIWTVASADSFDASSIKFYSGKLNKSGVEIIAGVYNPQTKDLNLRGISKVDPDTVIGTDIYSLKVSADEKVIYGRTVGNNKSDSYFFAMLAANSDKEFAAARGKIK